MSIIQLIRSRRSIRSFKPDPIPVKVLEELFDACRWAPSGANQQPWEFAILGGRVIEELKARFIKKVESEWDNTHLRYKNRNPDIPITDIPEPFLKRVSKLRATIDRHQFPTGTAMLDEKRAVYRLYGAQFYGAPSAIIMYVDKALLPNSLIDIGLMAQTICLAALSHGLGTCIMQTVVWWPDILRDLLPIPESKAIVLGIAIGYIDTKALVNSFERTREPLKAFAQWYGF